MEIKGKNPMEIEKEKEKTKSSNKDVLFDKDKI